MDGAGGSASMAQSKQNQANRCRLYPLLFSRPRSQLISRRFSLPISRLMFPTDLPTRSPIPSRTVPPKNRVLPFRRVNQMASHFPAPFPSRVKQTAKRQLFPTPFLGKTQPTFRLRRSRQPHPVPRVTLINRQSRRTFVAVAVNFCAMIASSEDREK